MANPQWLGLHAKTGYLQGQAKNLTEANLPADQLRILNNKIELDLPEYLPESSRHPQRLFSGRKLLLPVSTNVGGLAVNLSGNGSKTLLESAPGEKGKLSVKIPASTPSGNYEISYTEAGSVKKFPITIDGLNPQESASKASIISSNDGQIIYRGQICQTCSFFETVFTGDSENSQELALANSDISASSRDGGLTWLIKCMSCGTDFGVPRGDSQIAALSNGNFIVTGMYDAGPVLGTSSTFAGSLVSGNYQNGIDLTKPYFFHKAVLPLPDPDGRLHLYVDFPKLAVDEKTNTVYISSNISFFEDTQTQGTGFYISHDLGKTFEKHRVNFGTINSIAIADDGKLYAATSDKLLKFTGFNPVTQDSLPLPGKRLNPYAKLSSSSNRAILLDIGPIILVDASASSPHKGRLYEIWSEPQSIRQDSNFEYLSYGYNFNVFVSFSDNKGGAWSSPVQVNDDTGAADQYFASAKLDSLGKLHVTFIDHRNFPDQGLFDVYYAASNDGGVHFSRNVKVTDLPIRDTLGGRMPFGDYNEMVMPYPNKTSVVYPCNFNSIVEEVGLCLATIGNGVSSILLKQKLKNKEAPLASSQIVSIPVNTSVQFKAEVNFVSNFFPSNGKVSVRVSTSSAGKVVVTGLDKTTGIFSLKALATSSVPIVVTVASDDDPAKMFEFNVFVPRDRIIRRSNNSDNVQSGGTDNSLTQQELAPCADTHICDSKLPGKGDESIPANVSN